MPVHAGFGNHDYDVPGVSRELARALPPEIQLQPYYSVEHRGCKFVHLNNFLGATWTPGRALYKKSEGQPGRRATQLV